MQSVEKEGTKLYGKLSEIGGEQSLKLQDGMENCDMGPIIFISLIFQNDKAHIFRTSQKK